MRRTILICILLCLLVINVMLMSFSNIDSENNNTISNAKVEVDAFKSNKKMTLEKNNVIGILSIDNVVDETPIYYYENNSNLEKGITIDEKHKLPGKIGQTAIAGHRETFFKKLGSIKKNHIIEMNVLNNKYQYKVYKVDIIDEYAKDKLYIKTKYDEIVLITCYPFNEWSKPTQRYVVFARRIL